MEKNEIVKSYIEHIRSVSILSDDVIKKYVEELIEKFPESLNIFENFLSVVGKVIPIEIISDEEEKERANIREVFDIIGYAYKLEDIMDKLKEMGDKNPGKTVLKAIKDDFIRVDSIDDNDSIYFVLTEEEISE